MFAYHSLLIASERPDALLPFGWNIEGLDVQTATTRREALETARLCPPTVMLVDAPLPESLLLCREVKAETSLQRAYLVLLLNAKEETQLPWQDTGVDDALLKPVTRARLAWRIRTGLRLWEQERQLESLAQSAARLRHDLNNPLFAICGGAELALKRLQSLQEKGIVGTPEIIVAIERVLRGAERIEEVVQAFAAIASDNPT